MAYATLAEVRALDGLEDVGVYPDALLTEGITWATELVNEYCGPLEVSTITVRLAPYPDRSGAVWVGVPGLRAVTAATGDGTALDVSAWKVDPDGWVYPSVAVGHYYTLALTLSAGVYDTAPAAMKWAVRTLARQYVLDLTARTPDRATSVQTEVGTIQLAQAGGPGRPTSLPDVNAVLVRYSAKARIV